MILNIGLVLPLVLVGYYEIKDNKLYLRIGFFHKTIPYSKIKKITEVKGFTSSNSFALSIDRLRIEFESRVQFAKYIEVSPEDKERFMFELNRKIHKEEL